VRAPSPRRICKTYLGRIRRLLAWWSAGAPEVAAAPELAALAGVPAAWVGYACALVIVGFVVARRELRLAGLAILGVTALKLPVLDLAAVDQLYRVVSFLVAGVVMIGVSFVYHRVDQRFAAAPRPPAAPAE
jgi:uncharacterized membrane protein